LEKFEELSAENISGELKITEESEPRFPRTKSFKTNFSSSIELSSKMSGKSTDKVVGFII